MPITSPSRYGLYLVLIITLLACLWIGWRDYVPPTLEDQAQIRENIRWGIQRGIQIAIQYGIPIAILAFFGGELARHFRGPGQND